MGKLNLNTAEGTRIELTKEQQKEIQELYLEVSKSIGKRAEKAPRTDSEALRQQYLKKLQSQINEQLENIGHEIGGTITQNMTQVAFDVVDDNLKWLESIGMPVGGAFSHVPDEVVRAVATGKVYAGKWSLSSAIWGTTEKAQKDINTVIAGGIAQNKSAYDIAKDLEKYVDPSAKKDWSWSKVYPGTNKKVDYNAQRLARTMVSHAYQQAFVKTTQKNPFVTKYKWLGSNSHRICPICAARDGKLFEKDELPLDHPNGMCTFVAVMEDSMIDMADRLGDWAHGKEDPELEEYAKSLYGEKWGEPPKPKQPEYRYHATKGSSIPGIVGKGLKPTQGHVGKGVYFAESIEDAMEWTSTTSTGGRTLLRVPLDFLKSLNYEEYSADESGYGLAEGLVDSKIPFDKIEIKVGEDDWWTLSQYAKQYRNSVYNKLSPAEQKRVDRQWSKESEEWIKSRIK